jgi:hypothetical protein
VYVVCGAVRAPHWSVYIIPVTNGHNANIGNLIGLYHLTKAGPQPSMVTRKLHLRWRPSLEKR